MAFTSTDRENVQAAMVRVVTDGIAATTVGNQTVTIKSVDEGSTLLALIENDLAAGRNAMGLRFRKFTPTYT